MQTLVRNNDIRTDLETFMHGCILHLFGDEVVAKTHKFFLFSTKKIGAVISSKSLKEKFRGDKKNSSVNVHQSESKHRVRMYTNTACRAVARTHLSLIVIDQEVIA